MPAIVRSEFALALNQVATERGIDPTVVIESIKAAILAAYRKDYGGSEEDDGLSVDLDPNSGEAKVMKDEKDITPPGFGRIATQTAKQVILQRVREAEKKSVLEDFEAKVGTIASGMVLRFDGPNVIVDIGRAQAVMPTQEQSQSEKYNINQRLTFYIEGIRETMRGHDIIVSRAHKGLVEGLFRREVPEVAQGSVEIRGIAREAGRRTKIAVFSNQSGVDPVGSCVGQKGVRVQAVINELGGMEKVDIIQWSDDVKHFITAALAPASDIEVKLNEDDQTAEVVVPDDQLSLAIGRDGQNVRLAAKLTGWKIDIRGKDGGEHVAKKEDTEEGTKEKVESSDTNETPTDDTAATKSIASDDDTDDQDTKADAKAEDTEETSEPKNETEEASTEEDEPSSSE